MNEKYYIIMPIKQRGFCKRSTLTCRPGQHTLPLTFKVLNIMLSYSAVCLRIQKYTPILTLVPVSFMFIFIQIIIEHATTTENIHALNKMKNFDLSQEEE